MKRTALHLIDMACDLGVITFEEDRYYRRHVRKIGMRTRYNIDNSRNRV